MINLKAHPAENWEFEKQIIGNRDDSNRETSIVMGKDLTVTAVFKEIEEDSSPGEEPINYSIFSSGQAAHINQVKDICENTGQVIIIRVKLFGSNGRDQVKYSFQFTPFNDSVPSSVEFVIRSIAPNNSRQL